MPVTVDLPLVPPTAIGMAAALNNRASNWGRDRRLAPIALALTMSGTLSSIAAEATTIWSALVRPLPSWGKSSIPRCRRNSNFGASRPWSSVRSDPATAAPRP